jgi:short subunit dehydrogenase-like uncharacterized protein
MGPGHVALWSGGEVVSVPRHTGAAKVSVLMHMPRAAAAGFRVLRRISPVLGIGRLMVGEATDGPAEEERQRARFMLVAEARTNTDRTRTVLKGRDPYGLTAVACAEALQRLTAPTFTSCGALAPAEAFEPAKFLTALAGYLSWSLE